MTRTGTHATVALAAMALVLAACGSAGSGAPATTAPGAATSATAVITSPATSPASSPAATAPATSSAATSPATSAPIAAGEVDCAAGGRLALASFSLVDGSRGWTWCSGAEVWRQVVGVATDVVLVTEAGPYDPATNGQPIALVALDVLTGHERWRMAIAAPRGRGSSGPATAEGVVVVAVGPAPADIVGVDASTGAERWRRTPSELGAPPMPPGFALPPGEGWAPVAHGERIVILTVITGALLALDRLTGAELWRQTTSRSTLDSVVVRGDWLVTSDREATHGFDLATGTPRWQGEPLASMVVGGDTVVGTPPQTGPFDVGIRAIDLTTGTTRWSAVGKPSYGNIVAIDDTTVAVLAPPFDIGGVTAYALADGSVRWHRGDTIGEPQLLGPGGALVLLWEAHLGVHESATGDPRWQLTDPLGTTMMSSVGADDTTLFVSINSRPWGD